METDSLNWFIKGFPGERVPPASAQLSGWHINMQSAMADLSSGEEQISGKERHILDSPRRPSPSIYDYDYNWHVCSNQAFGAHSHAFSLLI